MGVDGSERYDVVDALQDDEIFNASLSDHITVEASESVGTAPS